MSEELKPCPFCGSTPQLSFVGNEATPKRKAVLKCPGCRIEMVSAGIMSPCLTLALNVVRRWNTRAPVEKEEK